MSQMGDRKRLPADDGIMTDQAGDVLETQIEPGTSADAEIVSNDGEQKL
ncbi:hypothetical protein ID866_5924 [Astraeus odoratus]|nr:hypothetical protein ID866_5924 [Astraeus odoratus]